ncbi:MAG: twin-arginine translocation signal domain-containing protein, partial [Anaerolineae bacterium]|nr:twin-arginine translocation signal domain-containing protein [Anaerolineae bacterium]
MTRKLNRRSFLKLAGIAGT